MNPEYDYLFKFLITGEPRTGKSKFLLRFATDSFTEDSPITVGIDFRIRTIEHNGMTIKLQLWDKFTTEERFGRPVAASYYRGAHGIFVFYDVRNRESFINVKTWLQQIERYACETVNKMLIGTMSESCTAAKPRAVTKEEGQELATTLGIPFAEVDAMSGANVEQAGAALAIKVYERLCPEDVPQAAPAPKSKGLLERLFGKHVRRSQLHIQFVAVKFELRLAFSSLHAEANRRRQEGGSLTGNLKREPK